MSRGDRRRRGNGRSRLSTPPEHAWPDGGIHHGLRVLLVLGVALLTTILFAPDASVRVQEYPVGTVVDDDVLAQIRFEVPLSPDAIAEAQAEARASTPPTFDQRDSADSMGAQLDRFFDRLDEAARQPDAEAQVSRVLSEVSQLTAAQRDLLLDPGVRGVLRETADAAVRRLLGMGVADNRDLDEVTTGRMRVRPEAGGSGADRTVSRDAVLSGPEFYARAEDLLPAGTSPNVAEILRLVLINHIEYTLVLNPTETAEDRARAISAVRTTGREILQDEAIVRANERITPETGRALEAHRNELRAQGLIEDEGAGFVSYLGAGILNLTLLLVFGLFAFFFRRELYTNVRWVVLLTVLVAVYIGVTGLVANNGWHVELLPIAFVALAASVLWDGRMALVLVLTLAALSSIQPGLASDYVLLTVLVGGSSAALSVRAVRRRAQTWIFIALISLAYAAVLLGHALLVTRPFADVATSLGFVAVNAIFSSILAMGFLPVFEWFAGVTTDQTLLEWADPNRSLLKRLSMEAPGTYAHTINVANLAESAANAIGASGLLCRVGLYYHDVGKMLKPHYFVENQPDGRNPHDRLKPETSAQIVKEHVVAGLKMAQEANVPEVVTDFIVEHHGTQRIGFFYEKAKEEYGEENVDVEDFTYPGPRPRSRETAIAMLADSVESATRALQDPTPERIRGLIDSIVESKIAQHQLDDAPLTLQELNLIKAQFAKVLSGVYHHRIDYPQTRHLTQSDKGNGNGNGNGGEAAEAPTADAGPGRSGDAESSGGRTGA